MVGIDAVRAKQPQSVPTVLTKQEVIAMIQLCNGIHQLVMNLLYNRGFRLIERLHLQGKDIGFAQQQIGKGSIVTRLLLPLRVQTYSGCL